MSEQTRQFYRCPRCTWRPAYALPTLPAARHWCYRCKKPPVAMEPVGAPVVIRAAVEQSEAAP